MRKQTDALYITIIAAVSVLLMVKQLATPAVFTYLREDIIYYMNWTRQFADSISAGIWYPRWMPDSHGGYGNPTFIFYSPLVIYITALLNIAAGDVVLSVTLVKFIGLLLSGLFMYLFIKDLYGREAGLAAAVMYLIIPFRVFDIYFLGVYASKFAFVWFPLIMYFTNKAVTEKRMGAGMAGVALTYALLCLTHLLSAYMFLPVFFAFGLILTGHGRLMHTTARLSIAVLLGLSLAAFFMLPVLVESQLVHLDSFAQKEWGRYWNNYLFYFFKPVSPYNPHFYPYLGRTVTASTLLGISACLLSRPLKSDEGMPGVKYFITIIITALFLMTSLSGPLWASVPGLKMVTFPTRWAAVMVFALSCLAGAAAGYIKKQGLSPRQSLISLWGVFFILCLGVALHYDADIIARVAGFSRQEIAEFPKDMDVEEYVPKNVSLEWLREEIIKPAGEKIMPIPPGKIDRIPIRKWAAQERSFTVDADKDTKLRVRTFYYPGWRALIDGQETMISTEPVSGAMLIKVPKGSHAITLSFSDTPVRKAGKLLSALAAALVTYLFARSYFNGTTREGRRHREAF